MGRAPDTKHWDDVIALGPDADDLEHAIAFADHAWVPDSASWTTLHALVRWLRDA